MQYLAQIQSSQHAPQPLESLFRAAEREHGSAEFREDIAAAYAAAPENRLLEAWQLRLADVATASTVANASSESTVAADRSRVHWGLVLPFSVITSVVLWLLSDPLFVFRDAAGHTELYLQLLVTPVIAVTAIGFLTGARRAHLSATPHSVALLGGVTVLTALAFWRSVGNVDYRHVASGHMPLLAWAAVGICLMGIRASARDRFAFLTKSTEVVVVTGVYGLAVMAFNGITVQLFKTLGITLSESVIRLLMVGGAGLMPIVAVATVYDPLVSPSAQDFRRGLSKMVTTLPRLLLVPTLVVLAVYVALIPAHFMQPFYDRTSLLTYNGMLFAVAALLIGATPVHADDLSADYQRWLRRGIVAIAAFAVLVAAYALAAVLYRTAHDRLTLNRLTVIGWNVIHIGVLSGLLYRQVTGARNAWIASLHATFSEASVAFAAWAACVVVVLPWVV